MREMIARGWHRPEPAAGRTLPAGHLARRPSSSPAAAILSAQYNRVIGREHARGWGHAALANAAGRGTPGAALRNSANDPSDDAARCIAEAQSPGRGWRNIVIDGYHGLSFRPCSQRQQLS